MDKKININNLDINSIDNIKLQKMIFIYNTLQDGWSIKRHNNSYIFTKKHENKKQVFDDAYLVNFLTSNMDLNHVINNI